MRAVEPHAHHWILDTPNGPTSRGECKHCGATREFPNYDAMDATKLARFGRTNSVEAQR